MNLINKYKSQFSYKALEQGRYLYHNQRIHFIRQEENTYYFRCMEREIALCLYRDGLSYWSCTCSGQKPCAHIAAAILFLNDMLKNEQKQTNGSSNQMADILKRYERADVFERRHYATMLNDRVNQFRMMLGASPKQVLKEVDVLCKFLEHPTVNIGSFADRLLMSVQKILEELKQTALKKQVLVWLTKNMETTTSPRLASFYVASFLAGDDAEKMEPILLKLMQEARDSLSKESRQAIISEILKFPFDCDPIDEQWEAVFVKEKLAGDVFDEVYRHFIEVGKQEIAMQVAQNLLMEGAASPYQQRSYTKAVNLYLWKQKDIQAMLRITEKNLQYMSHQEVLEFFQKLYAMYDPTQWQEKKLPILKKAVEWRNTSKAVQEAYPAILFLFQESKAAVETMLVEGHWDWLHAYDEDIIAFDDELYCVLFAKEFFTLCEAVTSELEYAYIRRMVEMLLAKPEQKAFAWELIVTAQKRYKRKRKLMSIVEEAKEKLIA